jgi:uroporphyrinogen-III synthase
MRTVRLADPEALRAVTLDLIARSPDYLVANTGLGMRTWFDAASEWGLADSLLRSLSTATVLSRGPKASAALTSAKLKIAWRSPTEQLSEIVKHLGSEPMAGRRIAFQQHGDDREPVTAALEAAGAEVVHVPVYRWFLPDESDSGPARLLIKSCCEGNVDAVTFTAGPQIRQMFELAEADGLGSRLLAAFNMRKPLAACIGPVCAGVAVEEGIRDPIYPDTWRLGSLVKLVSATLTRVSS